MTTHQTPQYEVGQDVEVRGQRVKANGTWLDEEPRWLGAEVIGYRYWWTVAG